MRTARLLALAVLGGAALAFAAGAIARGAAPPRGTDQPTIEGTPIVGQTLTAGNGGWANNPTSFRYKWSRCDAGGDRVNCVAISGATSRQYRLVSADANHQVKVDVTACNADGCATADSKGVLVSANTRPQPVDEPTISGDPQVGETLTANHGTWTANPTSYGYEWLQCDTAGNGCKSTGSRGSSYGVRTADTGHTLRVRVTARNARGATSATSAPTAVVGSGGGGGGSATPVSRVNLPDLLVISGIQFSPNPGRHTPITARFKVTDTRNRTIQGALVYVIGLPYGWTRNAPEQPTDGTGWATITLVPTTAMPRFASLVMFVRARKPGDNLLSGVSARRLVQLRIRG
ncbi:MAG TPA: hypothetical protein VGJ77_12085 [Gaiellaceae bacterium]|jgi:hypothetical protein